jgi:hypothetical protein
MNLRALILPIIIATAPFGIAVAQEFDAQSFVDDLNEALESQGIVGVTVTQEGGGPTFYSGTIAASSQMDALSKAIDAIAGAGDMLADRFCDNDMRPAEFTLSVSANFSFVIGVDTGTQVMWDIDKLCERRG